MPPSKGEDDGISGKDRSSLEAAFSPRAHRQRKLLYPTVGLCIAGVLMRELSVSSLSRSLSLSLTSRIRILLVLPLLPRRLNAGRL